MKITTFRPKLFFLMISVSVLASAQATNADDVAQASQYIRQRLKIRQYVRDQYREGTYSISGDGPALPEIEYENGLVCQIYWGCQMNYCDMIVCGGRKFSLPKNLRSTSTRLPPAKNQHPGIYVPNSYYPGSMYPSGATYWPR